jgi:hypothetical protein
VDGKGSNHRSEIDRHFGNGGKKVGEEKITLQEEALASPSRPHDSSMCLKTGIHILKTVYTLQTTFRFSIKKPNG